MSSSSSSSFGENINNPSHHRHHRHHHSSTKRRSASYSCFSCHKDSIPILSRERYFSTQHFCSFGCFEKSNQSENSTPSYRFNPIIQV
ncbi:hypothetical protein DDB_G0269276 [Dictyostelium discoideum AX4]|uniref:FLZ-type domain-containing protein n=1 Tax=Dictyostelium discoideum TaxID=44689 RepID=Q55ED9_DICDI|nr:hypothetical protein DDB_G0269276 [Dictyostelium discoideum AX4]EAL71988.1 hypothetical protein DDB_G0269276 [Dictyostelium discoideum AX4]|eukprot:XP_645842.1 hypothetical protein DDB_G0269276 [Dictyostelium discoideum AX4]